jgi:hypothetical protein
MSQQPDLQYEKWLLEACFTAFGGSLDDGAAWQPSVGESVPFTIDQDTWLEVTKQLLLIILLPICAG